MRVPRGILVCAAIALVGVAIGVYGALRFAAVDDRIAGYPAVEAGKAAEIVIRGEVGYYESQCFGCNGESNFPAPRLKIRGPLDSVGAVDIGAYGDDPDAVPRYSPGRFLNYSQGRYEGGPAYAIDKTTDGLYAVEFGPSAEPGARVRFGPDLEGRKIGDLVLAIGGFLLTGVALLVLAAWGISILLLQATRE